MGNCWRMPEDYSGLIDTTTPLTTTATASIHPLSNYNSVLVHSTSTTSDTHVPKVKKELIVFAFLM